MSETDFEALRAEIVALAEDVRAREGVGLLYWSDRTKFPIIAAILVGMKTPGG